MAKQKPLIDADGEVRELTAADFKGMKPFSALPKNEQAKLRKLGRPKSDKPKELVTVRLDADGLAFLRSGGPGGRHASTRWSHRPRSARRRRSGAQHRESRLQSHEFAIDEHTVRIANNELRRFRVPRWGSVNPSPLGDGKVVEAKSVTYGE